MAQKEAEKAEKQHRKLEKKQMQDLKVAQAKELLRERNLPQQVVQEWDEEAIVALQHDDSSDEEDA